MNKFTSYLSEAKTRNVFGTLENNSKLAISILRIRIDSHSSTTNLEKKVH